MKLFPLLSLFSNYCAPGSINSNMKSEKDCDWSVLFSLLSLFDEVVSSFNNENLGSQEIVGNWQAAELLQRKYSCWFYFVFWTLHRRNGPHWPQFVSGFIAKWRCLFRNNSHQARDERNGHRNVSKHSLIWFNFVLL